MDPRLTYIVKHKRPQVNTQPRERRGILGVGVPYCELSALPYPPGTEPSLGMKRSGEWKFLTSATSMSESAQ